MIGLIKNGFYWFLDYLYIIRREFSVYFRKDSASNYRREGRPPVLLLPGVFENWRFVRPLAKLLYDHDYDVHVLDELGYNTGTIEAMAARVYSYCDHHGLTNVALIAHSKGGLIGKQLLIRDTPAQLFTQLITINTPFAGSVYATYIPFKSIRIFSPSSLVLSELSENSLVNGRITAIYGLFDPHIPRLSEIEGAKNIQVSTYGHFRPISDPKVHEIIVKVLHDNNFC
ncbi:MAG: alpha/beta fold hydrolase [Candidatus Microsaccharimonas sp.]